MKGTLSHRRGHLRPRASEAQQPVTVCQKVPIHSKLMEKKFHVIWRLTNITGSTPLYFFSPVTIMRLIMEEASFWLQWGESDLYQQKGTWFLICCKPKDSRNCCSSVFSQGVSTYRKTLKFESILIWVNGITFSSAIIAWSSFSSPITPWTWAYHTSKAGDGRLSPKVVRTCTVTVYWAPIARPSTMAQSVRFLTITPVTWRRK